ncbi:MAG: dynamin family protein, partial [Myxococcota bacterium]
AYLERDEGASDAAQEASHLAPEALRPADALRVGQALLRAAEGGEAFLSAAAKGGEGSAYTALAQLAVDGQGDGVAASRLAVARGGGGAALELLGRALVGAGDGAGGAEAYEAAAQMGRPGAYERALEVVPLEDQARLESLGEAPDPIGAVARTLDVLVQERSLTDADEATLRALAEDGGAPARAFLALALLEEARGNAAEGLVQLDRYEEARGEGDAAMRRRLLRLRWSEGGDGVHLPSAIDVVTAFGATRGLREVEHGAERLREDLDRPLLLGVLGEFNAGKSTFIKAFIGESIAPTGIVPTTATLNVIRGGVEPLVRVQFRDGSRREGSPERLRAMLEGLEAVGGEAAGAAQIDRVEIVLSDPLFERVWLVDSPGTNALDPEHERLAREAAKRADAVLWIFDAAQAGKLTETEMHEALRQQGRRVIPVLNKADRLKDGELEEVSAVIEEGFGAPPVPLSAKAALRARLAGDDAALKASGLPALMARLEREVFSVSRELKRAATAGRLRQLVAVALEAEEQAAAALSEAVARAHTRMEEFERMRPKALLAVEDALRELQRGLDATFAAAESELGTLASQRADGHGREDRLFLEELIAAGVDAATERSARRLRAMLSAALVDHGPVPPNVGRVALAQFAGRQRGRLEAGVGRSIKELRLTDLRVDPRDRLRDALVDAVDEVLLNAHNEAADGLEAARRAVSRHEASVRAPLLVLDESLADIV